MKITEVRIRFANAKDFTSSKMLVSKVQGIKWDEYKFGDKINSDDFVLKSLKFLSLSNGVLRLFEN